MTMECLNKGKIFYLCNKKKCKHEYCRLDEKYPCKHTMNKDYALHKGEMGRFVRRGNDLWEVDNNEIDYKNCESKKI